MPSSRLSGILLHPTSFPSRFGIGDLGHEAYRFVDFLAHTHQKLWQILPLGPTGFGNSPYMCYSAMAGNPMLISPERLKDDGLLEEADFAHLPEFPLDWVDFEPVIAVKTALLEKACQNFQAKLEDSSQAHKAFETFCQEKASWLEDYVLYMALKDDREGKPWYEWDQPLVDREKSALKECQERLKGRIFYHQFTQFKFFQQWEAVKSYANEKNVEIIGDIPIYVAHDSADVWANRDNFLIDSETGQPELMAGVPPDYFSETGQLWGNPVYDWEYLEKTDFKWWIDRFQTMLDYVDWIRIDHFRGFESFWAVPEGEETAVNGTWMETPGQAFFEKLEQTLGKLPVLAEDLGIITPEVEALRDKFGFPGMKVLHFAFGSDPGNPFLPYNLPRNCLIYTGTHDNNTTLGWFESDLPDWECDRVVNYLGHLSPNGIHWDLIRLALSSVANWAIIPMQDLLGLDQRARMNTPGKAEGNWSWRYRPDSISEWLCDRLQLMTQLYGRS
ncbi:4-alpha-glucanotransferase [Roseofilum sp. BLCC_M91]|uniref:4-alpha-glucanotransferase n=1 Tax=Roseofilum halophilum BLCC-M91 TaxID=3022259 RepID=A0ABT7BME4_9CYAN|nr:4-alpha-glucanotransferase [Roseofilum halophilum]MDJ1179932.1 4-alpha-glucanotransferase [Roseofilum halophilum BLCC-M91]